MSSTSDSDTYYPVLQQSLHRYHNYQYISSFFMDARRPSLQHMYCGKLPSVHIIKFVLFFLDANWFKLYRLVTSGNYWNRDFSQYRVAPSSGDEISAIASLIECIDHKM